MSLATILAAIPTPPHDSPATLPAAPPILTDREVETMVKDAEAEQSRMYGSTGLPQNLEAPDLQDIAIEAWRARAKIATAVDLLERMLNHEGTRDFWPEITAFLTS